MNFLRAIFGRWQAPAWPVQVARSLAGAWRYLAADVKRTAIGGAVAAVVLGATIWYAARPTPSYVTYLTYDPGLTEYDYKGISSIKPFRVTFTESAAPLHQIDKPMTRGLDLSPKMPGEWRWTDDRNLVFTPKNDWPVDQTFTVAFDRKGFFVPGVILEDYTLHFHSAPFAAKISQSEFYQDPRDPKHKELVATVGFSHPVDSADFEARVALVFARDAAYLGLKPDSRSYTVSYDKFKLEAYVHSATLAMPRDDTPVTLRIDKGVRAARGGNQTKDRLQAVVTIPGRSSLRFSAARMVVVDNARREPEQVLMLASSSPVVERAVSGKVAAWLLPVRHPRQPKEDKDPYTWSNESEIGKDILDACPRLPFAYVSSEENAGSAHGFKFRAPVGRYLFVLAPDGIEGVGGYVSGKPYAATFQVEPYPQALSFLGDGALLSLSGEKKVGFITRDVDRVEVEIGRVLPNQLHHLAARMWNFARPTDGLVDQIVERFTEVRDYSGKPAGKPLYESVDIGRYLRDRSQTQRGLFLLHIHAVTSEGNEVPRRDYTKPRLEDTRLILVTDLGVLVKQCKDGSHDVFVQSIHTGQPVDGVRVEVVGYNGQSVLAALTENGGRAHFPKFGEWKREKAPLLILAQKDNDYSFMPFNTGNRRLELSRFDTGGVENSESPQQLSAYLFTDRGIYRPGETAHLGLIARTADWKSSIAGLPLDVEIADPRGAVVSRNSVKLSASAFEEIAFTSEPAAPTGTYAATAFLVKNDKSREILGSVAFKVQEFEPDRMKVRLDLSEKPFEGWLRPDDVKPRATVAHLFGEPAAGRRVEAELRLSPVLPSFSRYPDHRFQVGEALPEPFQEDLPAAVADDQGVAVFRPDLGRFTGRAYRLNLLVRAFEAEGGRNVAAQSSAIVSAAPFLVGVKPDGDLTFVKRASARAANWLAVDQQLSPVAADNLTLEWVQRKFVSVLTQQNDRTYKYVSRRKDIVRDTRKVRIAAGGSNLPLPTQEPGDFVLILRDPSGAELNQLSYSVAGEANLSKSLDRDSELQIKLDKPSYAGGDTIEVSIRAPYTGAGLITVERDRVLQHRWFKTSTTSSVQRIQLPRDFEGNGYVNVQFVRDPSSDEIFLSPLSYGVASFSASLAARTLPLTMRVPPEIRPGAVLTIQVTPQSTPSPSPTRVTVLAVDEGILQVARYKNPDPLAFFFQKRALEVQTLQILDLILPEFRQFLALSAPGGDADGGFSRHLNPFAKRRNPPVAWWSGIVDLPPAGRAFRVPVPDYFNGKLRIVAIAVGPNRIGTAQGATEVKGSFILTPNVPTMVSPGDEFSVTVGIFNNTTGGAGPIHVEAQPSAALAAAGPTAVDVQAADKKEAVAEFRFKANAVLGSADLRFVARRGAQEARIDETVSVRPPVAYRTQLTLGRFEGATQTVPLTRDMYPENRKIDAAVSSVPLVWGPPLIAWLDDYPYSCTEQLTSKGVAALLLASRPEFGAVKTRGAGSLAGTLSTLQSRQNDSGGFGLWASSPETAEFPTVYAAHFLLEASERGQKIAPALLTGLDVWLARYASTPAPTLADARYRAYAVYLLARRGIRSQSALANVEQELTHRYPQAWPTDISAAWLAGAYRLMQRTADADRLIARVPWSAQKRDWPPDVYYDPLVHDAQLIYLTSKHFPARMSAVPAGALEAVADIDSLSAAWKLLALDAYAKSAGKPGTADVGQGRVVFHKQGSLPGYYSLNESGFDRTPPAAAASQGVEVIHEFLDAKGNVVSRVKVGEEFQVRVRLRATKRDRVSQVAVVDLLPGGTEPVLNTRVTGAHNVDVREDRVVLYVDIGRDAATFVYRARATNAGVFQAPPAFAEGMYDRAVSGFSAPARLEVVKP